MNSCGSVDIVLPFLLLPHTGTAPKSLIALIGRTGRTLLKDEDEVE